MLKPNRKESVINGYILLVRLLLLSSLPTLPNTPLLKLTNGRTYSLISDERTEGWKIEEKEDEEKEEEPVAHRQYMVSGSLASPLNISMSFEVNRAEAAPKGAMSYPVENTVYVCLSI